MTDYKMPEITNEEFREFLHENFFNKEPFITSRKEIDQLSPKARAIHDKIVNEAVEKLKNKEEKEMEMFLVGKDNEMPKGIIFE